MYRFERAVARHGTSARSLIRCWTECPVAPGPACTRKPGKYDGSTRRRIRAAIWRCNLSAAEPWWYYILCSCIPMCSSAVSLLACMPGVCCRGRPSPWPSRSRRPDRRCAAGLTSWQHATGFYREGFAVSRRMFRRAQPGPRTCRSLCSGFCPNTGMIAQSWTRSRRGIMAFTIRYLVGPLANIVADGLQKAGYRKNSYSHRSGPIRRLAAETTPSPIMGLPGV